MEPTLSRLSSRKTIASLFLSPQCDMSCSFCASEQDFSVMSFQQAAALLGALSQRSVRNVVLGGGEPFLWPHGLVRISEFARAAGFTVQVCTNGVSLPEGFQSIGSIDRYILPLESMDPGRHDALRRHRDPPSPVPRRGLPRVVGDFPGSTGTSKGRGHHEMILRRIATLAGSGRELTVSTVLTRQNLDGLDTIADYLVEARRCGVTIHAWHLYRFLPVGRAGARNADRLSVTHAEFRRACAGVKRAALGFPVYRRDNMLRSSSVEFLWFDKGQLRIGSQAVGAVSAQHRGVG